MSVPRSTSSAPSIVRFDLTMLGEGREWNACGLGLRRRAVGGGNAEEAQALSVTTRQGLNGEGCGRPGAEADDHPVLNELNRCLCGCALQGVSLRAGCG